MNLIINEKNVELKYSIRAMMMYENITDKSFNPVNVTDVLTFFYCIVVASSKDYSLTFDDFIDMIDENPQYITDFTKWIQSIIETQNVIKKN